MENLILKLKEIAYNLSWSWSKDTVELFNDINPDFWNWSQHNPVMVMNEINPSYLEFILEKKNLGSRINSIYSDYKEYMTKSTYFEEKYFKSENPIIAYFSAEFGITECLKTYSGGLGVLSGDHMKSSSDLGIPLAGIGLAYNYGYFTQLINQNGWQTENYELNDFKNLPIYILRDENYIPVKVSVNFPGRTIFCQVWVAKIGRVKLYLLDTFIPENSVKDRRITDILYGGDNESRIMQEMILGIGGYRLLKKLGFDIKAYHLNEGHSAFLCFERIRDKMKTDNISYEEAKAKSYGSNIFTTHTPVPAGIDIFSKELFLKYFTEYAEKEVGVTPETLFYEGDLNKGQSDNDTFNMAYLAINNSKFINGVSKLHGQVSRDMWKLPETRSNIDHITNGVHIPSYVSISTNKLYTGYFSKNWKFDESIWSKIDIIPDEEIWALRHLNKHRLIQFCRERIKEKWISMGASKEKLEDAEFILKEDALTIGFARRFATYKRGTLIFSDLERLIRIVSDKKRPVQFIFSGKAHPKDEGGKNLISQIIAFTKNESLKNKIIFLDNYDINVARHLVEGCDLWLNNPRRPQEASGTSGMKVIANGGLNFSILDGWWDEAYAPGNGWKIDSLTDESIPQEQRDLYSSISLYDTLESEIIPAYYKRNRNGIPAEWIKMIKNSIRNLAGVYNTNRMVKDYCEKFYLKVS
ncbi:MAG TPA: alpha-glucan family phosphorylase [Ignavibacteria bacterium]|nr:alpha-glucan phosphorylase [Bacteroidota bacterium]HRI84586.1 alpha-glucan family phosphorylase [Ignavibacteria bacterium]HRK00179.1 alpha-glucan family phosphorylase [Ignavibacteria bacterium]